MLKKFEGSSVRFEIDGTSHSEKITLTVRGFIPMEFDRTAVEKELRRRNPRLFFNTQRMEKDAWIPEYGITGHSVESDFSVSFLNEDVNRTPYQRHEGFLRPNHSDYAQILKTGKKESGGGDFSGRITLPAVFLGALAAQELNRMGISLHSRLIRIGPCSENTPVPLEKEFLSGLDPLFPVADTEFRENAIRFLEEVKRNGDTAGAEIETVILNVPPGIGGPYFDRLENCISKAVFSIPAVKGLEFGDGFAFASKKGSEVQDQFLFLDGKIKTENNHCGGMNGGVSNGMPVVFRTAVKPVPTLKTEMVSCDILKGTEEKALFTGNHDTFIGNRIIPVIEAMVSITLLDRICYEKKEEN